MKRTLAALLLLILLLAPTIVAAQVGQPPDTASETAIDESETTQSNNKPKAGSSELPSAAKTRRAEAQDIRLRIEEWRQDVTQQRQKRRQPVLHKICQQKQDRFKERMQAVGARTARQAATFDTILKRLQQFYENNEVEVVNYQDLLAAATTQRQLVTATQDSLGQAAAGFTCDTNEPKAGIILFKDAVQTQINTLNDYRASIKDLLVAIKQAQKEPLDE